MSKRPLLIAAFCFFTLHASILIAKEPALPPQESLEVQRILLSWNEGDWDVAAKQIANFLKHYPDSTAHSALYAMLGDLHFVQKDYEKALSAYKKISNPASLEKVQLHYMQALFELSHYSFIVSIEESLKFQGPDAAAMQFLMAESLFKEGAKSDDVGKRQEFFAKSIPYYRALKTTEYERFALFPLAEIYKSFKDYPLAASFFVELAEKYPEKKEEALFQAAQLQMRSDSALALQTLEKIIELKGPRAKVAAYNLLVLLFKEKRFQDFVFSYHKLQVDLPEAQKTVIHYYLGKSYLTLGEMEKALGALESYISSQTAATHELREAILGYCQAAEELKDLTVFKKGLEHFATFFPGDPDREPFAYDLALLLAHNKEWSQARAQFLIFLKEFPGAPKKESALHHLVHASYERLKVSSPAEASGARSGLISDLELTLAGHQKLSAEEKNTYETLLAKLLFEDKQYEKALTLIEKYVENTSSGPLYLMAAISYKHLGQTDRFVDYAEKALLEHLSDSQDYLLRFELFNIYLFQKELPEKAASHLFHCEQKHCDKIKFENRLWLAHYFYNLGKGQDGQARHNALLLFEKLCSANARPYLEKEFLKYAELLTIEEQHEKKRELLERLATEQKNYPNLAWKLQRKTFFELAKAYQATGEKNKAIETYDYLIETSSRTPSYLSQAALLEKALLQYSLIPDEKKEETSPELIAVLTPLIDLQIQKQIASEPVHLEAALEYIEIKSGQKNTTAALQTRLTLLGRMQKDFLSEESSDAKLYHEARKLLPEKDHLFQTYMKFASALVLLTEAQIAKLEQDSAKQAEKGKEAAITFEAMLNEKEALSPYLERNLSNYLNVAKSLL